MREQLCIYTWYFRHTCRPLLLRYCLLLVFVNLSCLNLCVERILGAERSGL
jgi:hypothetical protein